MGLIFVSYRRDDSAVIVGRIYDRLSTHFGDDQVFVDINNIAPGTMFPRAIGDALNKCDALVAIIGKNWLATDGKRRLDDPDDWVRREISTALKRDILVIPVLVDETRMPLPVDLPDELVNLTQHQAMSLSNERFSYDIGRLIRAIEKEVTPTSHVAGLPVIFERTSDWPFDEFCRGTTEVFMTSIMLDRTMRSYNGTLETLLKSKSDACVKAVLPEPEVNYAQYDEDGKPSSGRLIEKLLAVQSSLATMGELMEVGRFELRFAAFQPVATIFMFDPEQENGIIHYLPLIFGSYRDFPRIAANITKQEHRSMFENIRQRYYIHLWNTARLVNKDGIADALLQLGDYIHLLGKTR